MFDLASGLIALGAISGLAVAAWLVSVRKRDVSIVDGLWPVFIWVGGLVYAWTAALMPLGWVAMTLLTIWAVRLCLHITVRNHGEPEDRRYQKIRASNQPGFEWKSLYLVFLLQAVLAWIVALPLMATRSASGFGLLDVAAIGLIGFGIVFEALADWQLARFKAGPANRARVMDRGLWRYTRHPNYFGEFCVWWGFFLIALAGGGWWTIVSPLLMSVLLMKVSGVTLLEKDIGERRPEYCDYKARTNAFFPGPRRGNP